MIRHVEPHHLERMGSSTVAFWVSDCLGHQYSVTGHFSHLADRKTAIQAAREYAQDPTPESARAAYDAYNRAAQHGPGNPKAASSAAAHIALSSRDPDSEVALHAACAATRAAAEHIAAMTPVGSIYVDPGSTQFQVAADEEEKWQLVDLSRRIGFELGTVDREFLHGVLTGGWDGSILDLVNLVESSARS